ncbi:MAG: hypothetical protein NDI58_03190 [Geothrix sp.]|nr:hypothetical protein [Geothrix sp.]
MVHNKETEKEDMSEPALPLPIPALLDAHTRMERGNAQRALADITEFLRVTEAELLSWAEIPTYLRQRVSTLCRVTEAHWERPEHDTFRAVLAIYRRDRKLYMDVLETHIRDRKIPEDRRHLAFSLAWALYSHVHGRPIRYQRWAVPPDCLHLLQAK